MFRAVVECGAMTTDPVVNQLAEKFLPLNPLGFFTPERAPDMWFGDELAPSLQAEMSSPQVAQSRMMLGLQIMRGAFAHQQHETVRARQRRLISQGHRHIGARRS